MVHVKINLGQLNEGKYNELVDYLKKQKDIKDGAGRDSDHKVTEAYMSLKASVEGVPPVYSDVRIEFDGNPDGRYHKIEGGDLRD